MSGRANSRLGPSASIINQENALTALSTGQPGRGIFSILDDLTLCQVDKQTKTNKENQLTSTTCFVKIQRKSKN